MAKVLVAFEESQAVTLALRERGVEAYSCDLQKCSGGETRWHIRGDAIEVMGGDFWDMVIAFPPCTHLASSGARWFKEKQADGRQQAGIELFMDVTRATVPRLAIENPIGIMSTLYRRPDQIVHPHFFGHGETKATCLWLRGLPPLMSTGLMEGREARIHKMPPSADRSKLRSKTYPGIAQAMAEQWGRLL